jgi:hypothetical protein
MAVLGTHRVRWTIQSSMSVNDLIPAGSFPARQRPLISSANEPPQVARWPSAPRRRTVWRGRTPHYERQISLNGSGLIAVYRTVLVMLAWPRKCWSRRVSIPRAARRIRSNGAAYGHGPGTAAWRLHQPARSCARYPSFDKDVA